MSVRLYTVLISITLTLLAGCKSDETSDAPEGMIFFRGGEFRVGTEEGEANEGPPFTVQVKPFYLSKHPVTVAEFRAFIEATGYKTEAERFGNSGVFNVEIGEWYLAKGATWEFPRGPDQPKAEDNHPVTQVSWNDAQAYCQWAGKRLPAEIEWEYAASNSNSEKKLYSWGERLVEDGEYKANVWQGHFPDSVNVEDGFLYTSPVGHFGANEAGLTDMGGNVWEWCEDTYRYYEGNKTIYDEDPNQKVIRGGSFLCDEKVCHGYRVTARSFNSRESATMHMGFRIAQDAPQLRAGNEQEQTN